MLKPGKLVIYLLVNVKMPTVVGILTFISRINFKLGRVEHEKSFITSGPVLNMVLDAISGIQVINLPQQGGGQPIAMVSRILTRLYTRKTCL